MVNFLQYGHIETIQKAMNVSKAIEIVPYTDAWKTAYESIAKYIKDALQTAIIAIEHVGSTSVKDLPAKPIIDIDIVIENRPETLASIRRDLEKIGYEFLGDLGIPERYAFKKTPKVTATNKSKSFMAHNLYVCYKNSTSLRNHLLLRNYLRTHADQREAYGMLKKALAKKYPLDIDAYVAGKTHFITEILREMGMKNEAVSQIKDQNKRQKK